MKAENEEQAEKKAEKEIDEKGTDHVDVNDRDIDITVFEEGHE